MQCLLIAAVTYRAAGDSRLRRQRLALAAAMLCWAAGYIAIAFEEILIGPHPATSLFDDVMFLIKAAPLLLLLTAGLDYRAPRLLLRSDLVSTFIFALLATILMLGDPFGSGQRASDTVSLIARDAENVVLATLAVATMRAQRRTLDRTFYRSIAFLLSSYAVSAAVANHWLIDRLPHSPGSAWLAALSLPFVAFHVAGALRPGRSQVPPRWFAPLRTLAPALLSAVSLLMAFAVAQRDDPSGLILGMAALVTYVWRTSLNQREVAAANAALRRTGRRLEALALTDPLTGIANRRQFDTAFADSWALARRQQSFVAVLIIDIDWFKLLNDALGHLAGDACLRTLAAMLADAAGSAATVARLGGEEFGVVTNLPPAAAVALAEMLRKRVEALDLVHPQSPFGCITVSIGIAAGVPGRDMASTSILFGHADDALYFAKHAGRNRCWASQDLTADRASDSADHPKLRGPGLDPPSW